jgi:ketosteroid isomerase-like protein
MSKQKEEIVQYFKNYMDDLNENGLQGVTSYYNEPSMMISPKGVTILESSQELVGFFQPMLDEFTKEGYERMKRLR